jgi:hypothetical protein
MASGKIGPWTTNDTKQNAVDLLHNHLDTQTIYLDPHYYGVKHQLYDQLTRIRRITERKYTAAGPVYTASISGKIRSAVKTNTEDDMAIALLVVIHDATSTLAASIDSPIADRWRAIHAQRARIYRATLHPDAMLQT